MTPRRRRTLAIALGLGLAPLLPLYPMSSLRRSSVIGHAGDVIDYVWSVRTVFGLAEGFRYDPPTALGIALDLAVYAALVAAIAFAIDAGLGRVFRR